MPSIEPGAIGGRPLRPGPLLGRATLRLTEPAAGSLELGDPGCLGSAERGQLVAPGLARRAQRTDLLESLCEGTLRLGDRRVELAVALGNRQRRLAPPDRQVRLCGLALEVEAFAIA